MADRDDSGDWDVIEGTDLGAAPETQFGDPENELPNVPEAPDPTEEIRDPTEGLPDPDEVDPTVRRSFWTAVLLTNIATAALSLGLLLIWFRARWATGGGLVVIGLLAVVRVYQTYRAFRGRDRPDTSGAS